MQGKSLYAILLSIIAVLALALAVLVIFLFTTFNNLNKGTSAASPSATPAGTEQPREVPASEQGKINLYATGEGASGDSVFNLKPSPAHDASFLMASITIVYDQGAKNKNAEERLALLDGYKDELKQACIEYFRSMTFEDLSEDAAMQKARDALKDSFTGILAQKSKEQVIVKIIFDKWILQ